MELFIDYFDSPLGIIELTADKTSLCSLFFVNKRETICNTNDILKNTKEELKEYFDGNLKKFSIPLNIKGTKFERDVYDELLKIPYGKTCSYKDIAISIGKENSYRAVGNANGKNKISIIIPCHRVITHNNKLGGYGGGLDIKVALLKLEGSLK